MPLVAPPIAYGEIRAAVAEAISLGTGLPSGAVVRAEPNEPNSPRPKRPFATFKVREVSGRHGPAAFAPSPEDSPTAWRYTGERELGLELNFFGVTQEDAYSLASAMQMSLEMGVVQNALRRPNIAVWSIGNVTDVSALLGTGYEGRAMLEVSLGVSINVLTDFGAIAEANVEGAILDDTGLIETITVNAKLEEA